MNSKIIDAVSIILVCEQSIFVIKRQNYMKAFPGYWAFPGGKVDEGESKESIGIDFFDKFEPRLMNALVRETQEELGIDLVKLAKSNIVKSVDKLGLAVTPDFNPHRYATYFFKITLSERPEMIVDENEASFAEWMNGKDIVNSFNDGNILAVPPVLKTYKLLGEDTSIKVIDSFDFTYDKEREVPMIESMSGVYQLMPLSNTLPPASRTNCFVIGDEGENTLVIDPSPKDDEEYNKLKNTLEQFDSSHILITHHHSDHNERADRLARELDLPMMMSKFTKDVLLRKRGDEYFTGIEVQVVNEGDCLTKWLGKDILVYDVPGHDNGQIAVAPKSMEWFLAGDLFQGVGTVVVGGNEADMGLYFKTLEKVIKLDPKVVFPSHGIGLGGTNIISKTLEHRKLRETQILELNSKGLNKEEILDKIYFGIPDKIKPYAMANIESHLKKLSDEGRLQ